MEKVKKQYIVVLRANSSVRIKGHDGRAIVVFKFADSSISDVRVTIVDISEKNEGVQIHKFLQFEVELEAENIEKASLWASWLSNYLLTLLCFTASANVSPAKLYIAYETSTGIEDREHIQFFYNIGLPIKSKRNINYDKFDELFDKMAKHERSDRIGRSLIWYRKSLNEADNLGKFFTLWIALEVLNPLLSRLLESQEAKHVCPECGYEENRSTVVGIRDFIIKKFDNGDTLYKKTKSIRNQIAHGFEDLSRVEAETGIVLTDLYKLYKMAVLDLLEIEYSGSEDWFTQNLTNNPKPYLKTKCLIHIRDLSILSSNNQHPHFEDTHMVVDIITNQNGETTYNIQTDLKPIFDARYTPQFAEVYGERAGNKVEIKKA